MASPTTAAQVTRIPTATVTLPPLSGHSTLGLVTLTVLLDIQPVPPWPMPGSTTKYEYSMAAPPPHGHVPPTPETDIESVSD